LPHIHTIPPDDSPKHEEVHEFSNLRIVHRVSYDDVVVVVVVFHCHHMYVMDLVVSFLVVAEV
jgi:hypothetical protein